SLDFRAAALFEPGGSWSGNRTYLRKYAAAVETLASGASAALLLAAFAPDGSDQLFFGMLSTALVFWAPHAFRGRAVLFSPAVIGLTLLTGLAAAPIFTLGFGWTHPLTMIILSATIGVHHLVNNPSHRSAFLQ